MKLIRVASIGECMIEMSGGADRQYRMGFAGDTLNTSWYVRALFPADWQVDYVTALGSWDRALRLQRVLPGRASVTHTLANLAELEGLPVDQLLEARYAKFRKFGEWEQTA